MPRVLRFLRTVLLPLALLAATPVAAQAQAGLQQRIEALLAEAGAGPRFGLLVTDEEGRAVVSIDPDRRYVPASNTKLLTTAAAYATLAGLEGPDMAGGASIALLPRAGGSPDVVLTGRGDARLSSAADCVVNCLAALADAVAARTRRVGDVIGDASLFTDQRWSPGMSWNNIDSRSGTGIAALSVDDNELVLRVTPGPAGAPPAVDGANYYRVRQFALTVASDAAGIVIARLPGSRDLVMTGSIAVGAEPLTLRLGIDDPAEFAAFRLRALLAARGVRVTGEVRSVHRSAGMPAASPDGRRDLERLVPPPLAEDIVRINKESQNLHAELLLRRLGLARGDGSIEGGVAGVEAMMAQAGAPRTGWDLSDGSGMSTYNRVSPRAMIALLRWALAQPWGTAWRNSFPIAGVDGTLRNRFRGTPLEGRLFAKTGTINAANALSGHMLSARGRILTFAFFANDMPGGASATARMDAALVAIAAAN